MTRKKSSLSLALLLMASLAWAAPDVKTKPLSGYGLETKDQQWVEAQALRLIKSPLVQAAQKEVEQTYRDDPAFKLPGAAATAQEAAYELTYRTAEYVITEDPVRPKFLWTYNATRKSSGVQIPGTTFIESVDSIYRVLTIGKGYHYEITGKRPKNGPAFITFEVWNSAQGLQPTVKYVTHLQQDNMEFAPDGSFKVLAGPEAADGRKNYLHTPEGGWLLIRQSLSDWSNQSIIDNLKVKLLGKVDRPAPTFAELEKRLIEVMPMSTMVNRTYMHRMFEEAAGNLYVSFGNTMNHLKPTVATRGGAWGYVTGTTYQIPRDKAFVVTIAIDDARYSAIQLHDAWGRTLDPVYMTNRNNGISARNADGTITYVLSERDPGVANWLDTRGIESGSLIMRWQGVTPPADGSQASMVRSAQIVAFDDLKSVLPKDVPMITADARREELQRRKIAFERRLR